MKKNTQNQHQFAFYYDNLSNILHKDIDIVITSEELFHRCKHVIRMKQNDSCIIFNQQEHVVFIFSHLEGKNKVIGTYQQRKLNISLSPHITFILPLLKIDALSEAIYALTEVGINKIQLIYTTKTQTPYSPKLLDKLYRIAIASAEQSKIFCLPTILEPITLSEWLKQQRVGLKYHFDVTGISFSQWYQPVKPNENYYLLVGPEGDLTEEEKKQASNAGFITCLLTPTILRSTRSISLVSGLFRLQ